MSEVSPLGKVPDGWTVAKLSQLTSKIGSGATPRGGEKSYLGKRDRYALIRSQCVHDRRFDAAALSYISDEQAARLKNAEVRPGDVLLNITGDGTTFARCSLAPNSALPACVNQHVAIVRATIDKLEPGYLLSYLTHPTIKRYIESFNAGGSRRAITKGHIENFVIPLPGLDEQRAIASLLGTLDEKIDLNRRMNETLEAMAQAIFKNWFVDFGPTRAKAEGHSPYLAQNHWELFPDTLDDQDKPEGWAQGTLADVAASPRRGVSPLEVGKDTPYIGLEHMPRRCIALSEWESAGKVTSNKSAFKRGEILFGKLRPYFHKVGFAPLDGICSTDIVVVAPSAPQWAAFTLACLSSDAFVDYTDQTSIGTKMPRTGWKTMGEYKICLPSVEAARAYQSITQPMIDRIGANIHESHTLAETRDLLLPKLMSGEIRLREAERVVEAVA